MVGVAGKPSEPLCVTHNQIRTPQGETPRSWWLQVFRPRGSNIERGVLFCERTMVELQGYWKFHRRMFFHPVWKRPMATRLVWITILGNANFKENDWLRKGERITIPAGTFITTQDHLAELAGVTRKQVRSAIKDLITLESISANQRANRFTEINIINWQAYQGTEVDEGQPKGQPRANQGPTKGQDVRREEGKKKKLPVADAPGLPLDEGKNGNHPIKALLAVYDENYHRLHHQRPVIVGLDAKAAATLLKNRTPEIAARMVKSFLENPPSMYAEKGLLGMRHILSAANTLLARREVSG